MHRYAKYVLTYTQYGKWLKTWVGKLMCCVCIDPPQQTKDVCMCNMEYVYIDVYQPNLQTKLMDFSIFY